MAPPLALAPHAESQGPSVIELVVRDVHEERDPPTA